MSFEVDEPQGQLTSRPHVASGMSSSTAAPKLDAKTTRRCAPTIHNSYIDRSLVATRYAPVPVDFMVLVPLTEWRSIPYATSKTQRNPRVVSGLQQSAGFGNPEPR